jgi:LPP20 lipoprotein
VTSRSNHLISLIAAGCIVLLAMDLFAADPGDVRTRAEQSFDQFTQQSVQQDSSRAPSKLSTTIDDRHRYSSDQYLIGKGQGDMAKGPIVCQRVSELSARTDLAKQIRILVKEHMVDRIRERTGRETEQDIEVTREEIVQEYLQGVKIVDRQIDEGNKTCSATAVMPKSQIQPNPAPDRLEATPTVVR